MNSPAEQDELDPVFLHARREAKVVLVIFSLFAVYTLGMSYIYGYDGPTSDPSAPIATVLGMPSWVFWAIVLPWILANVVTAWFCFGFMEDDPLGELEEQPGDAIPATDVKRCKDGNIE